MYCNDETIGFQGILVLVKPIGQDSVASGIIRGLAENGAASQLKQKGTGKIGKNWVLHEKRTSSMIGTKTFIFSLFDNISLWHENVNWPFCFNGSNGSKRSNGSA